MRKILSFIIALCIATLFAQDAKDYMSVRKDDLIAGVAKIDINFSSGAYSGGFGVFIDESYVVTNAFDEGYPSDINIKILDDGLLICIAKANLVSSNEQLSLLKITHYTDDYCNLSSPKLYHKQLISMQVIIRLKPQVLESSSPFLLKNARLEQGFPYFDKNGRFMGIFSDGRLIDAEQIYRFAKAYRAF